MRDFLDAILAFIGAESLTDEEFAFDEIAALDVQEYSADVYTALLLVLDTRESLSETRTRLKNYFEARGTAVTATSAGASNIFLGAGLDPCSSD